MSRLARLFQVQQAERSARASFRLKAALLLRVGHAPYTSLLLCFTRVSVSSAILRNEYVCEEVLT